MENLAFCLYRGAQGWPVAYGFGWRLGDQTSNRAQLPAFADNSMPGRQPLSQQVSDRRGVGPGEIARNAGSARVLPDHARNSASH